MTISPPPSRLAPPRLRLARLEDYPQIQHLEAAYLDATLSADEWPRLWLDNPLWPRLGSHFPIGWVLEDASGLVVGSLSGIPSLYRFRGQELVCVSTRAWVVRSEYRSFAPWLIEEFLNQPGVDLFIGTTANQNAAPIFSTFATRVPVGDWETIAYCLTGYRGFARKALQKRRIPLARPLALPIAAALWLKDALSPKPLRAVSSTVVVTAADSFDSRFDLFWDELVRQNPEKLLAARDSQSLAWHYAIAMRKKRILILTAVRHGLLRAYCVLIRQEGKEAIHRMRLNDYQTVEPETDLLPELLRAAVKLCVAEGYEALEHHGCGLPKMRSFDQFAPRRWKLANWPFYYHTANPKLAAELCRPEIWDPSTFDGDASIG